MNSLQIDTADTHCLYPAEFNHLGNTFVLSEFVMSHLGIVNNNRTHTDGFHQRNVTHNFLFFLIGQDIAASETDNNNLLVKISDIWQRIY